MSIRRNKGEGSITQQSNGKFRVRLETEPVDGKRHWLTATANTKSEAIQKLQELHKLSKSTVKVIQDDINAHIDPYLKSKSAEGLRITSLQSIKYTLQHLGRFLADIPVSKITKEHLQAYFKSLRDRNIECLKPRYHLIKGFFKWMKLDVIDEVVIKSSSAPKKKYEVLSNEEHIDLKRHMEDLFYDFLVEPNKWKLKYRMYPLYLLTYETGMREAEVAGLTWENVDFNTDTITVNSQVQYVNSVGKIKCQPKTSSGYRDIKVSHKTMSVLKELKEAYEDKSFHSAYLFGNHNRHGEPYVPNELSRALKTILMEVGITRRFTFHGIRHTNASLMFAQNVSATVIAERLGHSSIETTFRVYTHALQEDKDRSRPIVTA